MATSKKTLFSGILVAVTSMVVGLVLAARLDVVSSSAAQPSSTSTLPAMNSSPITGQLDASTFRDIAETQSPMVVNIRTESQGQNEEQNRSFGGDNDDLFRRVF